MQLFRAWGALRTGAWVGARLQQGAAAWKEQVGLVMVSRQQEEVTVEGDAPLDRDSGG